MLPKYHALAAAAAIAPLHRARWSPTALLAFAGAGVFVDVDHYLGYVWTTGDFSLRNAYAFHRQRYRRPRGWHFRPRWPDLGFEPGRALHALPVIAFVFLLSRLAPPLRPMAWGLLFHRLQDELFGWFR